MNWTITDLTALRQESWRRLALAPAVPADPFRLPGLATVQAGWPAARVVVLRRVGEATRELEFHTDIRSPKIGELRACPRVAWLFHDPVARVQIRATARAEIHFQDEVAGAAWGAVPSANAVTYASPRAPGEEQEDPESPLEIAAGIDSSAGQSNFALVRTTVEQLDWLWLRDTGHVRAAFAWADGHWNARWLTP